MEMIKDEVLMEMNKSGNPSTDDRDLCKQFFLPVEEVGLKLEEQLCMTRLVWTFVLTLHSSGHVVMRSFDIVRRQPSHLVTALRIIEREEQLDLHLLDQQKRTGFLPPDRPKFWRKKSLEKLRSEH